MPFADFVLRFDVKMSASSAAAGLYVRANREGNPNETGYRVPLGAGVGTLWTGESPSRAFFCCPSAG